MPTMDYDVPRFVFEGVLKKQGGCSKRMIGDSIYMGRLCRSNVKMRAFISKFRELRG